MKPGSIAALVWAFICIANFSCYGQVNKNSVNCLPVKVIHTFIPKHYDKYSVNEFWIYDSDERLILDSINAPDTIKAGVSQTEHYFYKGDSIISTGVWEDTVITVLNSKGLPSWNYLRLGGTIYLPKYTMAGLLELVTMLSPVGYTKIDTSILDSITYEAGNIIAYRVAFNPPGNGHSHTFTYYSDKDFTYPFNPTDKILAFCHSSMGARDFFNVQVFSKNLLKEEFIDGHLWRGYDYQLDNSGRVIQILRTLQLSPTTTSVTQIDYQYSCK